MTILLINKLKNYNNDNLTQKKILCQTNNDDNLTKK